LEIEIENQPPSSPEETTTKGGREHEIKQLERDTKNDHNTQQAASKCREHEQQEDGKGGNLASPNDQ